jgi:DNA-directed RNA polymerase alpha subunit
MAEEGSSIDPAVLAWALIPTDALEVRARCANVFKNQGIAYLGDLAQMTEVELLRLPNLWAQVSLGS